MLRILLIAILLFFILQAVSRLVWAIRDGQKGGFGGGRRRQIDAKSEERATRDRKEEDIEDARWKDL